MAFLNEDGINVSAETRERLLNAPFEHTLIDSENKAFGKEGPVVINTFGCPEYNDPEEVKRVGTLAKKIGRGAAFSLLLGDNNNKKGVKKKNSSEFATLFHDVHDDVTIVCLGNHDQPFLQSEKLPYEEKTPSGDIKKSTIETYKFDDEAALAQILHTFVDPATGNWDPHKIKCWEGKEVDLAELRKSKNNWNMPGRYGVLHCGHTDLFVIDSTRFVTDFINYFILKIDKSPNNQAAWFFRSVKESKAAHRIVASHHPFDDISKRNISPDHPDYLSPDQIRKLAEFGITGNYSEILNQIMFLDGLEKGLPAGPGPLITDAETAHHHANNYVKSDAQSNRGGAKSKKPLETKDLPKPKSKKRMNQWGSGGAGGPKQPRHRFTENDEVLYHSTDHGFFQRSLFADGTSSGVVNSLCGHRVQITNSNIQKETRPDSTGSIEKIFIDACKEFQAFLAKNPLYNVNPELTLQPTYVVTGKAYDWVPNFYENSDEIQNFLNSVNPHTQAEIEVFLKKVLTECAIDPAAQFAASKQMGEWLIINEPPKYIATLKEHHKKWKEIFEARLLTVFGMTYDEFTKSSSPKAKFLAEALTGDSYESKQATGLVIPKPQPEASTSLALTVEVVESGVNLSLAIRETESKQRPSELKDTSPTSGDPLNIVRVSPTVQSTSSLLAKQLAEAAVSPKDPRKESSPKPEETKTVILSTPKAQTISFCPQPPLSTASQPGTVRRLTNYLTSLFASQPKTGMKVRETNTAPIPLTARGSSVHTSPPPLKRALSAASAREKTKPQFIPKPKAQKDWGRVRSDHLELHLHKRPGMPCSVEARMNKDTASKAQIELTNALSMSV